MSDDPKPSSAKPASDRSGDEVKKDSKPTERSSAGAAQGAGKGGDATRKGSGSKSSSTGKTRTDPNTLRLVAAAVVSLLVGLLLGALIFGGDGDDEGGSTETSPLAAQVVTP